MGRVIKDTGRLCQRQGALENGTTRKEEQPKNDPSVVAKRYKAQERQSRYAENRTICGSLMNLQGRTITPSIAKKGNC